MVAETGLGAAKRNAESKAKQTDRLIANSRLH
jgi:hypothetical protein